MTTELQTFSTDPVTLKTIKDGLQEISGSLTRIEGERDFIKEAISELSEKTGVEKKLLRKLSKEYHKQSINECVEEVNAMSELYHKVFSTEE